MFLSHRGSTNNLQENDGTPARSLRFAELSPNRSATFAHPKINGCIGKC
jgi:hypothetical protein